MLFKYDEILKKYKNDVAIAKAIEKNKLYRLTRGIYSDKKYRPNGCIFKKVSKCRSYHEFCFLFL